MAKRKKDPERERREAQTIERLEEMLLWPFPKVALKRFVNGKQEYAQVFREQAVVGHFVLHEPAGLVYDNEEGPVIAEYEEAAEVVADGWLLD